MPKQNRGPYILAAGAAAQLLTGIPAAWGVFQQPVMQGYGFSRGQAMLAFAVLVAAYGVGCAVGGLLQDARGPRFAGLWGTALLAGGFFAAALVPPANAALFLVVYSVPAGLGSAFLAPAVLACAQKWYQDKKGWATGVAGVAMGLSGAFFTVFVRGVDGAWGIRVCFAALGAVMLVVCGAGALILQDPPPKAQSGPPQPGLDKTDAPDGKARSDPSMSPGTSGSAAPENDRRSTTPASDGWQPRGPRSGHPHPPDLRGKRPSAKLPAASAKAPHPVSEVRPPAADTGGCLRAPASANAPRLCSPRSSPVSTVHPAD